MNQAGGFREKNEDIACLCLKKEMFTSSLRLQIVTISATNLDEYCAFFLLFSLSAVLPNGCFHRD